MPIGGIVAGVGSLVGGGLSALGSSSAASTAAKSAQQSQQLQLMQMQQNIAQQTPFINAGQIATNQLAGAVGVPMDLSGQPTVANMPTPPAQFSWDPTMAGLAKTPGYQFTLQQGLQAQQNSATARGLGVSGAQLRGAADYAGGLASTTYNQQLQNAIATNQQQLAGYGQQLAGFQAGQGAYQNQFNDYWQNQQNKFNQLSTIGSLGESAAAGQGYSGVVGASNVGNAAANVGALQGAGQAAAANTIGNALNSPQVNTALTQGYNALFGGGSTINAPNTPNYNPQMTYGGFQAPQNDTWT